MNLLIIAVVLFGHWISDFVLQKNKLKPSKDKNLKHKIKKLLKKLFPHTVQYSLILTCLVFTLDFFNVFGAQDEWNTLIFFGITFITHYITDFITTMINSKYLSRNLRHKYFVMIGLDQSIHFLLLFWSIDFLYF